MIPLEIYKVIHLCGLMLLFLGFGGVLFSFATGHEVPKKLRAIAFITHGLGMFLLILGGFGMLARLGLAQGGLPTWIYAKLTIWICMGLMISPMKRKSHWTLALVTTSVCLGGVAAYIGLYKPF